MNQDEATGKRLIQSQFITLPGDCRHAKMPGIMAPCWLTMSA